MKWVWVFFLPVFLYAESFLCVSLAITHDDCDVSKSLESVEKIADCISVCDFRPVKKGQKQLFAVRSFFQDKNVAGRITDVWGGFDPYFAMQEAQKVLLEEGFPLDSSYVLFVEAGSVVQTGFSFSKNALQDDSYLILEKVFPFSCYQYNVRLVRATTAEQFAQFLASLSLDAYIGYSGVLPSMWNHASLATKPFFLQNPSAIAPLRTVCIEQNKNSAGEQSIDLLLSAHEKDKKNLKTAFALAQYYSGMDRVQDAMQWYRTYLDAGGSGEEKWFAQYKLGECYEKTGDWSQAFNWYLDAFDTDSSRPEPFLKIASYYRQIGKNDLAYLFAKQGSQIPLTQNAHLFPFLCNYQFDEELSIAAYYTRFREEGFCAANRLVLKRNVPYTARDQAYRNMLFYVRPLEGVRYQPITFTLPLVKEGSDEKCYPMNPSVCCVADGYKVICRAVNYTQQGAKHFHTNDPQGVFRSRNFLLSYDKDWNLLSEHEIEEHLERERTPRFLVEGMEDCRIFTLGQRLYFTCTSFDINPAGSPQIALCRLSDQASDKTVLVDTLVPLMGPDPHRCEKNWLPFVENDTLHIVYSCDPFVLYCPDIFSGWSKIHTQYRPSHECAQFRGSAAPVHFDQGYLMMVHEVVFLPDHVRCYLHRFVYLDETFHMQKLSKPFIFDHCGVEFCCGMTIDLAKEELILAIGSEDKEAKIGFLPIRSIGSMLEELPPITEYPLRD